jgi:hypothetical protein
MLLDAADADRGRFAPGFDACVVGAGPAGITLARRLAARGRSVVLMEAGGRDILGESQDQYLGENVGLPYYDLDLTRLRVLGGTSTHWGGWSRTLDAHDFVPLPHRPLRLANRQDRPRSLPGGGLRGPEARRPGGAGPADDAGRGPPAQHPAPAQPGPLRRGLSRRARRFPPHHRLPECQPGGPRARR